MPPFQRPPGHRVLFAKPQDSTDAGIGGRGVFHRRHRASLAMAMNAQAMNRKLVINLLVAAVGMFGFGFALAPMYTKLCELTGINNLQSSDAAAANSQVDSSRTITVQFDANLRNEL